MAVKAAKSSQYYTSVNRLVVAFGGLKRTQKKAMIVSLQHIAVV